MQHPNPHGSGNPNGQSPSVPLTVYRELAAELQATQAMLDSLHAQNQQLSRENHSLSHQNQQLLNEVHNVVNSALSLGQVADSLHSAANAPAELSPQSSSSPRRSEALPQLDRPQSDVPGSHPNPAQPQDPLGNLPPLYPNSSSNSKPPTPSTRPRFSAVELNGVGDELSTRGGLWLLVAIFAIIITAFGAGYWFMRPIYERLLQPPSQPQPQPQQPYVP
ncbi:MAG: hypothetical protein JJU32_03870 [Phormidium sp. BM_Day4_Bin.17]|nr:hypothetical protein [Phormidium sp. BM_Day4_Bin.17]UCJ13702.1 MAG: hypothetical protein JWS08_08145 [Phormidium sp. PBR-2020]